MKRLFGLSLAQKKAIVGVIFVMPFLIGFALFFLYPFIQAIQFSLSELQITPSGFTLTPVGWENYRRALFVNTAYVPRLTDVVLRMFTEVPMIVAFSFFAAVLINQKFKGRLLARIIFFLPVILSSGIVLQIEQWDTMHYLLSTGADTSAGGFFGTQTQELLMQLNIPEVFANYVVNAVDRIPSIIKSSGIQIVIFLAGLQSISPSLYEASQIEGASGWENFWTITLPMVSPLVLTNVIYTIIDSFTSVENSLVMMLQEGAFTTLGFGQSSAMSIMYFGVIIGILLIVGLILSRLVFYHD